TAGFAVFRSDLDDVLGALVGLGQRDLDLAFDVFPLPRASSRAPAPAEKIVHRRVAAETAVRLTSEQRPEEIGEVAGGIPEGIAAGAGRSVIGPAEVPTRLASLSTHALRVSLPVRADRVVALALLGIAEDLVGLVDLLELLLGLGL